MNNIECNLGVVDFDAAQNKVNQRKSEALTVNIRRKKDIRRFASENGASAAARKFNINESTARGFKSKYEK